MGTLEEHLATEEIKAADHIQELCDAREEPCEEVRIREDLFHFLAEKVEDFVGSNNTGVIEARACLGPKGCGVSNLSILRLMQALEPGNALLQACWGDDHIMIFAYCLRDDELMHYMYFKLYFNMTYSLEVRAPPSDDGCVFLNNAHQVFGISIPEVGKKTEGLL